MPYTGGGVCSLAKSSRTWAITASVCALRPSENSTGTRWRVCIYSGFKIKLRDWSADVTVRKISRIIHKKRTKTSALYRTFYLNRLYHSAPSAMVCPVISSKHSACAQSWISSNGSGLGLPRLYSTGFRRPV